MSLTLTLPFDIPVRPMDAKGLNDLILFPPFPWLSPSKGPYTSNDHRLRFRCTSDPIEIEVNHFWQDADPHTYTNLPAIPTIAYGCYVVCVCVCGGGGGGGLHFNKTKPRLILTTSG